MSYVRLLLDTQYSMIIFVDFVFSLILLYSFYWYREMQLIFILILYPTTLLNSPIISNNLSLG